MIRNRLIIRIIIYILIINIKFINPIVYIPQPDERGPIAWNAGVNCLKNYAENYFTSEIILTRAQNILLTHIWNLTSPAAEIEMIFIKDKNENITNNKKYYGQHYQIRIISDNYKVDGTVKIETAIMPTDYYVIITDNIINLKNIFLKYILQASSWYPAAKFIILYNNIQIRNKPMKIANEIFEILHKYSATNVTLLYAINITSYKILLLNNYNPKQCRKISIENYGYCINGNIIEDDNNTNINQYYHHHIKDIDLHNCTYYLCSRVSAPFVETNCNDGIEINLILEMQERLKFQLISTCETDERGVLSLNGTWTHLLGKLIDKSCDFIIGGFYMDNEVQQDFWVTDPYLSDLHTWYIALAKKIEPWKGLIMIFQLNTWEAFVFVIFISWLIWYLIGSLLPDNIAHKSLSLTALNTLAVIIGCSVNNQPKLQTLRIFFMALALYGLNVSCLYTSNLISVFSHPRYEHQISTLDEVIKLGIPFGGPEENKDWFTNDDDKYILDKYSTEDHFEPEIKNLRLVRNGIQVMLLNRMFVLQSTENSFIYGFPDDVFRSQLQIITKKGFPLLYQFNQIIRRFRDAGLFDKIHDDFVFNNTILKNIRIPPEYEDDNIILTTHHLSGAFAVLIIGYIFAVLSLIVEYIAKYFIIPWINKYFGLKIDGQKKNEIRKTNGNVSVTKELESLSVNKDLQNYILRRNDSEFESIRFTPVERRRIIIKGRDFRKNP